MAYISAINYLHLKKIVPFLSLILFFSACHKSDTPSILQPTESGQNVIAFTLNGQQHVYRGAQISFNITQSVDSMVVDIGGFDPHGYKDFFDFTINIPHFSMNNLYYAGNDDSIVVSCYADSQKDFFWPDSSSKSTFIFTRLDSLVGAGTFQYKGIDYNGNTITLANGFFDIGNPFSRR